ncbi:MAG: hypothetical protein OHK0039_28350 [Bacteroidia bacterium]
MSGNVWEWYEDDWHEDFSSAPTDCRAWVDSPRGAVRVSCGGGWSNVAGLCRVARRFSVRPADRFRYLGLRLARSIDF